MLNLFKLLDLKIWALWFLSLLVASGSGLWVGISWEQGREAKKELRVVKGTIVQANKQITKDVAVSKKNAAVRTATRFEVLTIQEKIHDEVTKIVLDPTCRISDDGVRDINKLVDKANGTGQRPDAMLSSPQLEGWVDSGISREPQ